MVFQAFLLASKGTVEIPFVGMVIFSWQRPEEWHAEDCRRSVRCEVAPEKGGEAGPGDLDGQPAQTYLLILNRGMSNLRL